MRFLNPAGLWLLLGVPILIIIYLIKSQHEDRPVSSTFIWKLSERFAKKRLPIRRLRRILLFILQLLMIILAAFMAAKPVMVKGQTYDYVVILDGSASMQNVAEDGSSRFENALSAIEKQAKDLSDGHTMTVILAGDTASYLLESSESTAEVQLALDKAYCSNGGCNVEQALELAQSACDRSDNAKVLFYTDCDYEQAGNITVVNMSREEWNVSLTGLEMKEDDGKTMFVGSLVSYYKDAKVTVGFAIDGKTIDAKSVSLEKDVVAEIIFEAQDLTVFDSAEIYIETKDALSTDNRFAICQQNRGKYNVLLISENPLYLESALNSLDTCHVTVASSADEVALSGMDLYIFDGIVPKEYPTDGSLLVFGTEYLPQGLICGGYYEEPGKISFDTNAQSDFHKGLSLNGAVVKEYTALMGNRDWENILYCDYVPVMVSRVQKNGTRFTVASFDLHNSNLPLMIDYPILINNLLDGSVPKMLPKTDYVAGESMTVTLLPGTEEVYLQYPDANVKSLYMAQGQCVVPLSDVGVYTLAMKGDDMGLYCDFFVHIPLKEGSPQTGGEINIAISSEMASEPKEAISNVWFWFALALLLILLMEWGWYYYEQY